MPSHAKHSLMTMPQVSINALCTEDKKVDEMPNVRGKPWVTMLQSSVSFLAGHDEVGTIQNRVFQLQSFFPQVLSVMFFYSQVLSVMVPLADGESEEEELLPSRRASLRFEI